MFEYESVVNVVDDGGHTEGFCVCLFKNNKFISLEYYSSKTVADEVSAAWNAKNYTKLANKFHC